MRAPRTRLADLTGCELAKPTPGTFTELAKKGEAATLLS